MTAPCIHGEVCRAYIRKFGLIKISRKETVQCILSRDCPVCPYYEPITKQKD